MPQIPPVVRYDDDNTKLKRRTVAEVPELRPAHVRHRPHWTSRARRPQSSNHSLPTTTTTTFHMSILAPDEADLSPASEPHLSPTEESDAVLSPIVLDGPEPNPGINGQPVRCEWSDYARYQFIWEFDGG